MKLPSPKIDDVFLLFYELPFDFSGQLPLALGPGICLDDTPWGLLDTVPPALADSILPGYHLRPSPPRNHCCLRSYDVSIPHFGPDTLLFVSLSALRLRAPLGMHIAGSFTLGPTDNQISKSNLYQLRSPWQPQRERHYTPTDISAAADIASRLIQIDNLGYKRITTALVYFSQVTVGLSESFQLSYLGLFAALEALFVLTGNKAATLGARVSSFLAAFDFPEDLVQWLSKEYRVGRNNIAHGVHEVSFRTGLSDVRGRAFGRLHEIVRLCILGFMALRDEQLNALSTMTGTKLQKALDTLGPASGRFIEGQRMCLD
ncbi:MAG TPA: hypothetical protein VK579_18955 [Terriglobales bacterium]|nr:hypothetical protein [Terriglobales bacterium]